MCVSARKRKAGGLLSGMLLAMLLALGLCPMLATADTNGSGNVEATITMNATSPTAKLYAASDTAKATDLLASITPASNAYTVSLPAGDYVLEGFGTDGTTSNGTIALTVGSDSKDFSVTTITAYASNSGFVYGTDYTLENLSVARGGGDAMVNRTVTLGNSVTSGQKTFLMLNGDTYSISAVPTAARSDTYVSTSASATLNSSTANAAISMNTKATLTITYPYADTNSDNANDYVLEVGTFSNYYVYSYLTPVSVSDPADGKVVATYNVGKSSGWQATSYFYRVSNPVNSDVVTYGNFVSITSDTNSAEVTTDNLRVGDGTYNRNTVINDLSVNKYDTGDLYLNVNSQGSINLAAGASYDLYPFRNWLAIESFMNSKIIEPDFHVQTIDVTGTNVVSVTEKTANDSSKHGYTITGNSAGTAIVLVTYDAMTNAQGWTATGSTDRTFFSAIWPENTGVFVVTVGADGQTSFDTGMKINAGMNNSKTKLSGDYIDSEFDTLYYYGTAGATYTFTPAAGTTVQMAVPSYDANGNMTFGAFSSDGVTVANDGSVTLSGLTKGKTIVKLVNGSSTEYQVIRSEQLDYQMYTGSSITAANMIYDSATGTTYAYTDGTTPITAAAYAALDDTAKANYTALSVKAGDKVTVGFTRLYHPANKLPGIYNMSANSYFVGEDGTTYSGTVNQYLFASTTAAQQITITVPKYWTGDTYSIDGMMHAGGFGSAFGMHRTLTYWQGRTPNFVAASQAAYFGDIPTLTVALEKTNFLSGTMTFHDGDGNAVNRSGLTVTLKDSSGNTVSVGNDGSFVCDAETYSYTVMGSGYQYAAGTFTVSETGKSYGVKLQKSSEGAWDGVSTSEPATDASGTYLISNGDELAWFASQVNSGKASINAKLTADIDLAKYPWTSIGNSSKVFKGTFDGQGHTISNFYQKTTSSFSGLFGEIDNGAQIQNLTLSGAMDVANGSTGALCGYVSGAPANKVTISNCTTDVDMNVTGDTTMVGGMIGYSRNLTLSKCKNAGDVTAASGSTVKQVGGLVGYFVEGGNTIESCYNTGSISATDTVGGIIGYASSGSSTITSCYNTGAISGTSAIAGLLGDGAKSTVSISDSYNVGEVTGATSSKALYGGSNAQTISNCYYLVTSGNADSNGTSLTSAELSATPINSDTFGMTCFGGYPALLWQTDVQFHTVPAEGVVTAPTCTEKGYTTYVCPVCGESFPGNYVAALGHTPKAGTERTTSTYTEYICARCGEYQKTWNDQRFEHMSIPAAGISNVTITDDSYPWTYDSTNSRFVSTNVGTNRSTSTMTLKFTLPDTGNIAFGYGVSSESGYDFFNMTLVLDGTTPTTVATVSNLSGENTGSIDQALAAGSYTLTVSYSKDAASASGSDLAYISGLTITSAANAANVTAAEPVKSLINAIGTVTAQSGDAITAARTAYDALSTDAKANVDNYSTLLAAESAFKELSRVSITTCTVASIPDVTYTGAAAKPTVSVSTSAGVKLVAGTDYTVSCSDVDAGTGEATITGIGNYTGEVTVPFAINKANLTITANDASKIVGDSDPVLTYTATGLQGGDVAKSCTVERASGESVGTYAITPSTVMIGRGVIIANKNYNITYAPGTFTIIGKSAPTITTTALATARANEAYSQTLVATGVPAPTWTWAAAQGSMLPDGLTLDAKTGTISGTPTTVGTYTVTVTADNGTAPAATATFKIDVVQKYKQLTGTAYISINDDNSFIVSDGKISNTSMNYVPIDLAEVSKVDLDDYSQAKGTIAKGDLSKYKYDADGDGTYETTLLQLYVYVLNNYSAQGASALQVSGSAHSMFFDKFWDGHDQNLTYYFDGAYPLDSSLGAGMGATADTIVLHDGDFADVSMYSDWSASFDTNSGYHYFLDSTGTITHNYTTLPNTALSVTLGRTKQDWSNYTTSMVKEGSYALYYGDTYGSATAQTVTTDENGVAQLTFTTPGTYYVWANSGKGELYPDVVTTSPACAKIVVAAAPTITTTALASTHTGDAYSQTLVATGTPAPTWSWAAADGSTLPDGLTLDAKTGTISGTPTTAGSYKVVVTADNGTEPAATATYTLTVNEKYKQLTGTAYVTLSKDGKIVTSDGATSGTLMGSVPVDLAEVSKVDLDSYGLGAYKYDADNDGTYETTGLQLYLYVLDNYYSGKAASGLTLNSGSTPGGLWIDSFWGVSNPYITYSINGQSPVDASTGWGATIDHVSLAAGDSVFVPFYTASDFWGDANQCDHYFVDGTGAITSSYNVSTGNQATVTLDKATTDSSMKTTMAPEAGYTLSYGTEYGTALGTVTTATDGSATITFPSSGKYYVWADGSYGATHTTEVVSSAALATVTVCSAPAITTTALASTHTGDAYSQTLVATGTPAPTWSWAAADGSTLPDGLTLDAKTGTISGTATTAGSYKVVVTADNGTEPAATATYTLTVNEKYKQLTGTAYVTLSKDGKIVTSDGATSGTLMGSVPVDLAEVSKVDLDSYGLGAYKYDADNDGTYETTGLQLYLYVLDNYYSGKAASGLALNSWSSPGSLWIDSFWGVSSPWITYTVNGQTPIDPASGYGATADHISLADGDSVFVPFYTASDFWGDANQCDHYFVDGTGAITSSYGILSGSITTVTLDKATTDSSMKTTMAPEAGYTLSYGKEYGKAMGTVTTAADGTATIAFPSAGKYYVWADGSYGATHTTEVVSSAAVATVTVSNWTRLSGGNRYATMENIVDEGFAASSGGTVIVASGTNFPDALAASGLAGVKSSAIVLTNPTSLSDEAKAEIQRLKPTDIIIVGGTGAVSSDVESQLTSLVADATHVSRLSGSSRIATALEIYKAGIGSWSNTAIITTGSNYADALSIAPYAYAKNCPLFLASNGELDADTIAAIKAGGFTNIVIAGGTGAVSDDVETQLGSGYTYTRLSGGNRYETSAKIAQFAVDAGVLQYDNMAVASGDNFPDALAGAALCGKNKSVLLLANDATTGHAAVDSTIGANTTSISEGYFLGGTGAVSADLATYIESLF